MSTAVAAILGLAYVIGAFITRKRPIVLNYSASGGGAVVQVVHYKWSLLHWFKSPRSPEKIYDYPNRS